MLSWVHWIGLFGLCLTAATGALWLNARIVARSTRLWHDPRRTRPLRDEPAEDLRVSVSSPDHGVTAILDRVPAPIWCTGADGDLLWRNAACADILDAAGAMPVLPARVDAHGAAAHARVPITGAGAAPPRYFDVQTCPERDGVLHFAQDVTRVVQAEELQREFLQTLTKTFASLTVGLAIFDRNRQLALFNPALFDLTRLPVEFLSGRPDMMNFFDQLRERQVMPEPRDYGTWREQIRDAVAQARDGLYQDLWSLPNGLTYRVTGRPHPDGAIAFLFEDVSAEMSLTRRFRTQIELRQEVMDAMRDAVAVVSSAGAVLFCNQACVRTLGIDPDQSLAEFSETDLMWAVQARFGDTPAVRSLRSDMERREAQAQVAHLLDRPSPGRSQARLTALSGGNYMLVISEPEEDAMGRVASIAQA